MIFAITLFSLSTSQPSGDVGVNVAVVLLLLPVSFPLACENLLYFVLLFVLLNKCLRLSCRMSYFLLLSSWLLLLVFKFME